MGGCWDELSKLHYKICYSPATYMNFAVSVQYVLLFQQLTQHIAARTALAETFVSYVIVSIYFY